MRVVPREMSEFNPVPECSYCVPGRFLLQVISLSVPEPDVAGALQYNMINAAPGCSPERTGMGYL